MKRTAIIGAVIFGTLVLVNVAAGGVSKDMNLGEIIGVIVALSVLGIFRLSSIPPRRRSSLQ
jgi:hypothetical protein